MAAIIELADVAIGFPGSARPVLSDLALTVRRGEFAAVVGASGAGKSTLLRVVAGLMEPLRGSIHRHLEENSGRRSIAIVFQEARLMPWRRVHENVALGLEGLGLADEEVRRRVSDALALVGLRDFAQRWPHQLSGGQRQRVDTARTLTVRPGSASGSRRSGCPRPPRVATRTSSPVVSASASASPARSRSGPKFC
jgi:NitT/TauT family transport system ATP-binding protein